MVRKFLVLCLLVSLVGSFAMIRTTNGQSSDEVVLGDAPTADSFSVASVDDPGTIELSAAASVDPSTRANAQAFYNAQYVEAPAANWTGSYSSCNPGTISSSFKNGVLQRIVYYRAMAGVPADVGLSSTYSSKDQAAALIFGAQGALSHDPPSSWACYSAAGDEAAGSSNIALGASGTTAVDLYMRDPGSNNAAAGHRRWLLYPQTQTFGTGDTTASDGKLAANAVWVFDGNFGSDRPGTRDGFVAWPNKGYVPYTVVPTRWSLSYPGANFAGATITVTTGGQPVQVAKESVVTGYGENTVVWQMEGRSDGAAWPKPAADKTYHVRITGVGGSVSTFDYNVIVFDPATNGGPTPTPTPPPSNASASVSPTRTTVNSWVTYNVSGFPANTPLAITWRRLSGSTIAIDTVQTNGSGAASGRFRVPATPGGPNQQIIFKAGSVSKTVLFEVAPRIKVNTDPAIRGQVADVSLRGYDKQETVRIRWLNGSTWVQVATVVTSNTGSANVDVVVPDWAPTGLNSVRGDGTVNRQQTNVVNVQGDVSAATPGVSATASVTATATTTETVTPEPTETAVTETVTPTEVITETVTAEPTVTETATELPTETEVPTEVPTEIPTEEPPPVETLTATETEVP
jgi:hypothetical protein